MKKILIANRGEIALRIMRSVREMGIKTVAIFSEADRNALFVRYADEAVCIGPPPSSQSYLQGDKIIEISKQLGVDGIHPGYGFLSENADFARKVKAAGITFIGPSAESMDMMGDKLSAKATAKKYNVPMIPGSEGAISDLNEAIKIAKEIGFPLLIKASAGGGGKGMRLVEKEDEIEEQMNLAVSEAISAFGNGAVFIERYASCPRHIEIQLLADNHGNCVYLFERECSIQRRHQKLIEEAPSSVLSPELRKKMGECAVDVAKACNYSGAGTVEFLLDDQMNFYFLEMNTRLQVEHPVSEMITGIDLQNEQNGNRAFKKYGLRLDWAPDWGMGRQPYAHHRGNSYGVGHGGDELKATTILGITRNIEGTDGIAFKHPSEPNMWPGWQDHMVRNIQLGDAKFIGPTTPGTGLWGRPKNKVNAMTGLDEGLGQIALADGSASQSDNSGFAKALTEHMKASGVS